MEKADNVKYRSHILGLQICIATTGNHVASSTTDADMNALWPSIPHSIPALHLIETCANGHQEKWTRMRRVVLFIIAQIWEKNYKCPLIRN